MLHDKQYGFRTGRGNIDAATNVIQQVKITEKNVIGIFTDISGAFDNTWWSRIVAQLQDFGVNGKEFGVIKDYFNERYAIMTFRGIKKEK